ncbi:MAG TPA: UDP-glucose 4-epimerase GalE [candidate division Zixibacteria bacterium]|mgnify:CR=1 FL=1|nr:UDP-glucose 4-epimerase GalE [candidate division Zixibacteria bacterium]
MAKFLLTGGAGYIGSHTNLALAEAGHETLVFDDLSTGFRELVTQGELIVGDLLDQSVLDDVLEDGAFDAVIHFAAKNFVGESFENPSKYWRNNVLGTRNLLDSMSRFGPNVLVFSSSCAVYGEPVKIPISEDHPLAPLNPYGRTKLACEWMIEEEAIAHRLKFANLRYFNAVGADPEGRIGMLLPSHPQLLEACIDTALGKRDVLPVFGNDYPTKDGTGLRDFIHVSDLASAHIAAAERLLEGGNSMTLNLGTGKGFTVFEVIREVEKQWGDKFNVELRPRRSGDPAVSVADSLMAQHILAWNPRFSDLETIVATALNWQRRRCESCS